MTQTPTPLFRRYDPHRQERSPSRAARSGWHTPAASTGLWKVLMLVGSVSLSCSGPLSTSTLTDAAPSTDRPSPVEGTQFTGTIKPRQRVTVNAPLGGTVRRLLVNVGDEVAAAQPLIEVDDEVARASLNTALLEQQAAIEEVAHWQRSVSVLDRSVGEVSTTLAQALGQLAVAQRNAEQIPGRQLRDSPERAQAVLDQATTRLARMVKLQAQGIVSEQELEDQRIAVRIAENDLENARQWHAASAELRRAQEQQARLQVARSQAEYRQQRDEYAVRLAQARARADQAEQRVLASRRMIEDMLVRATAAGVIVDVSVGVGDRPAAGTTLMTMATLHELVVEVPVASRLVNVLRPGQQAVVTLPTIPVQRITGRIATINPIPAANMTHMVEVRFTNTSGRILSGQPAEVAFR